MVLITKGDLLDQERKLAASGLGDLFAAVEIVSEKDRGTYDRVFARHGTGAAEAVMAGNSMKSDVLPALEAGAAGSFMLSNRGPRMLEAYGEEGAEVLSRLDIFVKDMGIVSKAARATGLPSPVAAAAEQLFLLGQAQGLGTADDSAVIRVVAPERRS